MRVLFIYPVPDPRFQALRYQQGIGSIAATLKQAGHAVQLLILSCFDKPAIEAAIHGFNPGLVAVSLTSGLFALTQELVCHVAAEYKLPAVLGGIHPTLCPEESLAAEGVMAVCVGEGEYPMLELCAALDANREPAGIASLWFRRGEQIIRNPIRPLIENLDSLPFPDREVFPFADLLKSWPPGA